MNYKLTYTSKKQFDDDWATFEILVKIGEANFKYRIFGQINSDFFPLKERINNWLKAIVCDKEIKDIFVYESDDCDDYYEHIKLGMNNEFFVFNTFEIPYKLIKSDLINFLIEFRDLTDRKSELSKFQNNLLTFTKEQFPVIKKINESLYYFSSPEIYRVIDLKKEWIEQLKKYCNSDCTNIELDEFNKLYHEGDSVRSHYDYRVGCGLTEGWEFWGKFHPKFKSNLLEQLQTI